MESTIDKHASLGAIVTAHPAAARIFEEHGIDYCCGGEASLVSVCEGLGIDTAQIMRAIEQAPKPEGAPDWPTLELAAVCDEIERRWHRPLDDELPRLDALARKVAGVHRQRHPELDDIVGELARLVSELQQHMMKEERVLFPMIRAHGAAPPPPIQVMRHEHEDAGASLARLRALTGGYDVPPDGCASYRELFASLAALERDLHAHIHVENNILFVRAGTGSGVG